MGGVTRVFISGASGFIGQATVAAARAAGMQVVAPTRDEVDLAEPDAATDLAAAMQGCDAVIHLAAARGGEARAHERVTINGTRAVLTAMHTAGVGHLVLASSLSAYRLEDLKPGQPVRSDTQRDTPDTARDAYAKAKLTQEALAGHAHLQALTILRPGIVYDDTRLWNAHLGVGFGPVLLQFDPNVVLPMCHVDHLASALVAAVQSRTSDQTLVVDATLPSREMWIARLQRNGWPKWVLPFPWGIMAAIAKGISPISKGMPGLLRSRVLYQRRFPLGRVTSHDLGGAA